ncbi:MAG: hypothetical protein HRT89_18570 [Lentisphaeria bacterium]|nr:hypothetical protein [Lentisphaeria bacterium]NQZ70062.1 hypothetical protein [Lentisphaeria bacterium]
MKRIVTLLALAFCAYAQNDALMKIAAEKAKAETNTIGLDGFVFTRNELVHLSKGSFLGEAAKKNGIATKVANREALPALIAYNAECKKWGVDLIIVPIPAKAVVYPDKLDASLKVKPRIDKHHQAFYKAAKDKGLNLIDVTQLLIDNRDHKDGLMYCKTDSHYSALACQLIATEIAKSIKDKAWYKAAAKVELNEIEESIEINGDLLGQLPEGKTVPEESIKVRRVTDKDGNALEINEESPVILLGDSHTLVYHDGGDMLTTKAGLFDQLAYELKIVPHRFANKGSGATAPRVSLYRKAKKGDFLKKRKVIIWVFTVREFTQSFNGWRANVKLKK